MNPQPLLDAVARTAEDGLRGLERQLDVPAPCRPTWQRWVLPVFGTFLTVAGVVLFFLPFTNLLLVAGLPLMCCFSRRCENAARLRMSRLLTGMRRWIPRRHRRVAGPLTYRCDRPDPGPRP